MTSQNKKNWLTTPWKYFLGTLVVGVVAGVVVFFITNSKATAAPPNTDTVPKVIQTAKIDSGSNNKVQQQNGGSGNFQIQQGAKSKVDIRLNSPTIHNHNTTINVAQFEYTNEELISWSNLVQRLKRDSGATGNIIALRLLPGSNGQRVLMQFESMFRTQGFAVVVPQTIGLNPSEGLTYEFNNKAIQFYLGYFKR